MSLLNFLKKSKKSKEYKQKEAKKPQQGKQEPSVLNKKVEEIKQEKTSKAKPSKESKIKKRKISGNSYRIFSAPLVTEKASLLEKENKYIFKVFPKTNKANIKQALEDIYKVDVLTVRIINIPRKPRRIGRHKVWKKGYKKAIIKLKEGQRIDIISR